MRPEDLPEPVRHRRRPRRPPRSGFAANAAAGARAEAGAAAADTASGAAGRAAPPQDVRHVVAMLSEYFAHARRLPPAGSPEAEAMRFLQYHQGVVIVCPDTRDVERAARDLRVVAAITRDPGKATASRLAALHSMPRRAITKTCKRVTGRGVAAHRSERAAAAAASASSTTNPPGELLCRHPRLSRLRRRVRV